MFTPPRCPKLDCIYYKFPVPNFFQRRGSYHPKCRPQPVPIFRCKHCRRHFSRQTFRADYYDHKPDRNQKLGQLMISGVGQRQAARILKLARSSVEKKFKKLALHFRRLHENLTGTFPSNAEFMLDELETFEGNRRTKRLTVPVLIETTSLFIVDAQSGTLPAIAGRKRRSTNVPPRTSESSKVCAKVLERAASMIPPGAVFRMTTDQKSSYPGLVRRALEGHRVLHETHSGLLKSASSPLFLINLTLALMRDHLSRLRRRSWLASKKKEQLDRHMAAFMCWRNFARFRTNREKVTPAQVAGLSPRRFDWGDLIGWRQVFGPLSIDPRKD